MDTSNTTHNEWIIHRELGDEIHLARERKALPRILAEDEELLAVASAGYQLGRPGILAITDRRLIHLYFRRLLRSLKTREISYGNVKSIAHENSGSAVVLAVRLRRRHFPIDFPIAGGIEHAAELATCARKALARFDFHADQEARGLARASINESLVTREHKRDD